MIFPRFFEPNPTGVKWHTETANEFWGEGNRNVEKSESLGAFESGRTLRQKVNPGDSLGIGKVFQGELITVIS